MATLDPGWLLRAWEIAADVVPAARGAVLVHEAGMVGSMDAALDLPVNELTVLLARLHSDQFGPTADGLLTCDACGQELDVSVPLELFASSAGLDTGPAAAESGRADPGSAHLGSTTRIVALHSGRRVRVRVPTIRDLLLVRSRDDVAAALQAGCVSEVDHESPSTAGPAPPLDLEDLALVDAAVEELAGVAALVLRARCPTCGAWLAAPVDVASFLWDRVERDAPAALADIADLASTFGWTEADILRLTPARRGAYLAFVRGASA